MNMLVLLQVPPKPSPLSVRPECNVYGLAYSPDGRFLAAAMFERTDHAARGEVLFWDLTTRGKPVTLLKRSTWIRAVDFTPDGRTLVAGLSDKTVRLFDLGTREWQSTFKGHTRPIVSLAMAADGRTMVTGAVDRTRAATGGEAIVWDLALRKARATLPLPDGVWSVAYAPDGKSIAVGGRDKRIHLWDAVAGVEREELKQGNVVRALAFSADGKTLAAASGWSVKLWDLAARKERATLTGHKQPVDSLAFTRDGRTLVSGAADGTVRFWDAATGNERAAFDWQLGSVQCLAFSPDGMTAAAGGKGPNSLVLWDVDG
jgi:WD40 repeat protein